MPGSPLTSGRSLRTRRRAHNSLAGCTCSHAIYDNCDELAGHRLIVHPTHRFDGIRRLFVAIPAKEPRQPFFEPLRPLSAPARLAGLLDGLSWPQLIGDL